MVNIDEKLIIEGLIYGIIFIILLITGLILLFIHSKKKIIQKEIESKNKELKYQELILQSTLNIQEEERERIARELHDAISSKLTLISLSSHHLLNSSEFTKEQTEAFENIINLTSKTLENSRVIAHELIPPLLSNFGLIPALEELIDEYRSHSNLDIHSTFTDLHLNNKKKDLHVFRIIQELLNNAIKHSGANCIEIEISTQPLFFKLSYKDNGTGLIKNDDKLGIGIQNIKSRTSMLNGTVNMYNLPDKGLKVEIDCFYE